MHARVPKPGMALGALRSRSSSADGPPLPVQQLHKLLLLVVLPLLGS